MAAKSDNLPADVDIDLHNGGTIKYATEVIAIIAGVAASEVEGIAGMCTSGGFVDKISRNRNITRGIKVEMGGDEVSVDIYAIVEYGHPIHTVALEAQENVRKAIESMTGLNVVKVDVHVQGVSFEKENQERTAAIEATRTPALEESRPEKKKPARKNVKEQPVEEQPAEEEAAQPEEAEQAAEPAPSADAEEDAQEAQQEKQDPPAPDESAPAPEPKEEVPEKTESKQRKMRRRA